MIQKRKRIALVLAGISGTLLTASSATVALSSCTTTSNNGSTDLTYTTSINWSDPNQVANLVIDNQGLVYASQARETIIAVSPRLSLANVIIPKTVKSIGGYNKLTVDPTTNEIISTPTGAFEGMESLVTVTLSSGTKINTIGISAFKNCTNLQAINNLKTQVESVANNAFQNCTKLKSIDLSGATFIGDYAFQNCSSLESIGTLNNALRIGDYAFNNAFASTFTTELILKDVTYIGTSAFQGATGITNVNFTGNTTLLSIGDYAFENILFKELDLSGSTSLKSIGSYSFANNTSLTTVYLPEETSTSSNMLQTIGDMCFYNNTSLTTVAPKSLNKTGIFYATSKLNHIGNSAFYGSKITSIDLENMSVASDGTIGSTSSFSGMEYLSDVTLVEGVTTLGSEMFTNSGKLSKTGFSLVLPSTITSFGSSTGTGLFAGSSIVSIDMSKIQSYSTSNATKNILPEGIFNGCTKLESVVLKPGTTSIGTNAFKGTTSLKKVVSPDATTQLSSDQNGFIAASSLTVISGDAFRDAFAEDSNAVLDLSAMSFQVTPSAFSGSNIKDLKLPSTTTIVDEYSFYDCTKLATVNFSELTELTTFYKNNFNNTQLTEIDLSNTKFNSIQGSASGELFTNLPTTCEVSLPVALTSSFSQVFTDTTGASLKFNFPNGISINFLSISGGKLQNMNTNFNSELKNANFTNISTINSISTNTFFDNKKLTSVALNASGLATSSISLFSSANLVANTSTTTTPETYIKTNVPFGNNSTLKTFTYSGFSSQTATESSSAQETLFSKTNQSTWTGIAKVLNAFSSYSYDESTVSANPIPANVSTWTDTVGGSKPTNADAVVTWAASTTANSVTTPAKVTITNSYKTSTDTTTSEITISATDSTATFVHNGITWTYTNNGTNITLTGEVNMYKAANNGSGTGFLVFFDEQQLTNGSIIPSQTKIAVTLSIAK